MDEQRDAGEPPELDLRVARILDASRHPDADRLLVLQVDLGEERRQIVAGLVGHYEPDELPGKRIVMVANLKPAVLRGQESRGMLLAAEDEDGRLGLLTAPDAEPGQRVSADDAVAPAGEVTFAEFKLHDLRAEERRVTQNGRVLRGAGLVVDRAVRGPLH